jgi:seryl-tRNA synthetase
MSEHLEKQITELKQSIQNLTEERDKLTERIGTLVKTLEGEQIALGRSRQVRNQLQEKYNDLKELIKSGMEELDYDDLCSSGRNIWDELAPIVGLRVTHENVDISVNLYSFTGPEELEEEDFEVTVSYRGEDIGVYRINSIE